MMGSGRAGHPPLPSAGVAEAKALAFGFEDVAAVREAVEGGSGEPFAAEHLGPLLEGQDRRQRPADHAECSDPSLGAALRRRLISLVGCRGSGFACCPGISAWA